MKNDNDLRVSLTQALQDMKMEQGESFSLATVNLAALEKRTVMTGFESVANNLLRQGVKNSSAIFDRLKEIGYKGSLSGVKR